jgi:hypothetical protein
MEVSSDPAELCDRYRPDDDFILGETLLEMLPVCLPPWAVEGIRHDLEDDDIVMYRGTLGVAAAFRGSPGESGDAAEPARQLFPDDHVFLRIEGLPFVVCHGQQYFNEMHGSPPRHRPKRNGVTLRVHGRDRYARDGVSLELQSKRRLGAGSNGRRATRHAEPQRSNARISARLA